LTDTDGDLEPMDGGLKKESGSLRSRRGTGFGRLESSGRNTVSKRACSSESESPRMWTTWVPLFWLILTLVQLIVC